MQEGILSLMQMPRTTIAVQRLRDNRLPYIVVLTDPTTGGVTASYAMLGDIHIAEPGALICFAGPRVIQQTIREQLPEGFQRAEYLLEHGMIDMVIHRHKMRETLSRLTRLLVVKRLESTIGVEGQVVNGADHPLAEPSQKDEDAATKSPEDLASTVGDTGAGPATGDGPLANGADHDGGSVNETEDVVPDVTRAKDATERTRSERGEERG